MYASTAAIAPAQIPVHLPTPEVRATDIFRRDVIKGLSSAEKKIPSKYFYDSTGDQLFQQIMSSPDYYLTRCEAEIFRIHSSSLVRGLANDRSSVELYELGSGDATKTVQVLKKLCSRGHGTTYRPIDISANALSISSELLKEKLPEVKVQPVKGDYFEVLDQLDNSNGQRIFMFLGSNIGNLTRSEAVLLLRKISTRMSAEDRLLVGFDLKKDPRVLRRAYDDRAGITRQFNFNLLHRINMELGADFHLDQFSHEPIYDPCEGRAISYLVSKQEQWVTLPGAAIPFHFKAWEAILTEVSHKFDPGSIHILAQDAGLKVLETFNDRKEYFADVLFALK
jgi:dimethylhistidine N-methyltransferase